MGQASSTISKLCKKVIIRYNANYRAEKFLEKEQLPVAPRHSSNVEEIEKIPKSELKKIHEKNEQLTEYLKKVYLTSTSTVIGTPSSRPKPKKENEIKAAQNPVLFVEPKQVQPNHATLSNIVDILCNFNEKSKKWNSNSIIRNFNLNKADFEKLITNYSLFTKMGSDFLNADKEKDENEKHKKISFEVFKMLEKKPLKQISDKK